MCDYAMYQKDIEKDGYVIRFQALVEDTPYEEEDEAYQADIRQRINDGEIEYFCAKVTFIMDDVEYAVDYLGGCCYDSYEQFIEDDDYFGCMCDRVMEESFKKIRETAAKAAVIEAMMKVSS